MAKYFLLVRRISRGKGANVTRAAAYRSGERIYDERMSRSYDFTDRTDIPFKEVVLPRQFTGSAEMEWARNRATLWNAAEHAGRQRNSLLAREVLVALPPELTANQRAHLTRTFAQELADRYRNAVDVAVHLPRPSADPRHHHAHLLMTTREVTPQGLAGRTSLELSGSERRALGLGGSKQDLLFIRERWAQLANEALRDAGLAARIDHRSYVAQGIDREPKALLPPKVFYSERALGTTTPAGDAIRQRHRERVEARRKGPHELAMVVRRQKEEAQQRLLRRALENESAPKRIAWAALTRDERNQLQRERYQAKRATAEHAASVERRRQKGNEPGARPRRKDEDLTRTPANVERVAAQQPSSYRDRQSEPPAEHTPQPTAPESGAPRSTQTSLEITRQEAVKKWLEYRAKERELAKHQHATPDARAAWTERNNPTAEQAVRNWLEYRKSHGDGPTAEEAAQRWREQRESMGPQPTAEDAARRWRERRESMGPEATAEEAARRWREQRESMGPEPTAEDAARRWREYRESIKATPEEIIQNWRTYQERQQSTEESRRRSHRQSQHREVHEAVEEEDLVENRRRRDRGLDNDFGL